jgi:hypothetical protein
MACTNYSVLYIVSPPLSDYIYAVIAFGAMNHSIRYKIVTIKENIFTMQYTVLVLSYMADVFWVFGLL